MQNEIGDLGEAIFNVEISRDYLFRPRHLGEKWPVSDFYVELIGPKEHFFFIVQVKATAQVINKSGNLKIKVTSNKLKELNNYYCPTYLAGVNVNSNDVYLIPINKAKRNDLNQLPSNFPLNSVNRRALFDDVKRFWGNTNIKIYKNKFKHSI